MIVELGKSKTEIDVYGLFAHYMDYTVGCRQHMLNNRIIEGVVLRYFSLRNFENNKRGYKESEKNSILFISSMYMPYPF